MGNKHTLHDDLITFKLTSKQMARSAKKCDKNMAAQKEKLKTAIKQGNMEGAKIYAQNVIREKNQSLNFLRMGSRIDAVASRLETAIRMQEVNQAMGMTVKGMANAMKSMNVEQISRTMSEFEKQFEDMDVRSGGFPLGPNALHVYYCCNLAFRDFQATWKVPWRPQLAQPHRLSRWTISFRFVSCFWFLMQLDLC